MAERRFEAKLLYRRLDSLFGALDPSLPIRQLLDGFLKSFFAALKDDLRIRSALLYGERRDGFELLEREGQPFEPVKETLPANLPPLRSAFRHGVYVFRSPAEDNAPCRFEIVPEGAAAALVLGRRPSRHVLFFHLGDGWVMEELDFILNTVRAALASRLMEERVRGGIREAAEIQQSLLLDEPPPFAGYEIAFRSLPTEEVSGDFFDFLPFGDDEMLGFAIGDASGHGLPAALLVRDVVTGLRMGIEKDLKVTHVFRQLNRVIHRSNLSSRFVSVFYGELESDGTLIYVNAGHQPPLLFFRQEVAELATGGTVIGPLPEAAFRRGFARIDPGAVLVLVTDGLLERRNAAGDFFGVERLTRLVREIREASAEEILDRVFSTSFSHGDRRPWEDDATAVVIRRLPV